MGWLLRFNTHMGWVLMLNKLFFPSFLNDTVCGIKMSLSLSSDIMGENSTGFLVDISETVKVYNSDQDKPVYIDNE